MKITICGSIDVTYKIKEVADALVALGHTVEIPYLSQKIINGEILLEDFLRIKQIKGDLDFRKQAKEDLIKRYYNLIKDSDAILVVNVTKKGIENYIGGNSFLEIGFAYVLGKKIFLLNDAPEMSYSDEILIMQPIIINSDLKKIV
ncbi:MAG: hypothetical protein MUF50_02780 [Planctomycetes bacterium]|jgi:hypothetical protein|nr:hypothetical protein [Planctomycetota bacterium]